MPMKQNHYFTSVCKLNYALIFYILHLIENKFCQGDTHGIYSITVNLMKIASTNANARRKHISIQTFSIYFPI